MPDSAPAYTWRADRGRQETTPPAQPQQNIMFFASSAPSVLVPFGPGVMLPAPGMFFAYPQITTSGAAEPAAEAVAVAVAAVSEAGEAAPPTYAAATSTIVSTTTKKSSKSSKSSKTKTPTKSAAGGSEGGKGGKEKTKPASVKGTKYIYPKHHICVHVIRDVRVWEDGYCADFECKVFNVGTSKSVGELIEDLLEEGDDDDDEEEDDNGGDDEEEDGVEGGVSEKWAVTEVFERGDGRFQKVGFGHSLFPFPLSLFSFFSFPFGADEFLHCRA